MYTKRYNINNNEFMKSGKYVYITIFFLPELDKFSFMNT